MVEPVVGGGSGGNVFVRQAVVRIPTLDWWDFSSIEIFATYAVTAISMDYGPLMHEVQFKRSEREAKLQTYESPLAQSNPRHGSLSLYHSLPLPFLSLTLTHTPTHTRAHTLTQAPKHIGMCALFLYPTVALLWMAWVYLSQALPPDDKNWQMLKPELTVRSCHLISCSVMDQTNWASNLFLLDQATSRSANMRRSTQTLLTCETLRRKNHRLAIFETRERLGSRPGRLFSFRNSITSRALLGFSQ